MKICIINKHTNELLALISDTECIEHEDILILDYGENDPVLTEKDGKIYLSNTWITYFNKGNKT